MCLCSLCCCRQCEGLAFVYGQVRSRRRDDGFEVHALNSARVLWSGGAKAKKTKTKLCVVYIHGWSASPQENQVSA
jgi:hypothetical protein